MKVAVMGAGAVGGYLGASLRGRGGRQLIARGAHLEAMRTQGLTLVTPEGERSTIDVHATDSPAEVGTVDIVLFLVKSYDTEAAARQLRPLIGEGTGVISLQNGVDNEPRIAAAVGPEHVLGGAAYILSAIEAPGVVRSGHARLVVGELLPGPPSERVIRFVEAANAGGGITAAPAADVRIAKWEKYVLLVAFSAVTAATHLTVGDIRGSDAASAMMRSIMDEAWSVGRAMGVPLADDLVERQHALVLAQKDAEATSLRHDLLTGIAWSSRRSRGRCAASGAKRHRHAVD